MQDSTVKNTRNLIVVVLSLAIFAFFRFAREGPRLDSDWHFKSGESAGAEKNYFDDHDWQTLSLPHSWGWETAQQGKEYYRGPGWYRRRADGLYHEPPVH